MPRPDLSKVPEYYHKYIGQVPENDLMEAFKSSTVSFTKLLESIPASKHNYKYGEDKWTIKEVLQHIIDGERVFAYRALRFARKDPTPLPGFEENIFAANAKADKRNWNNLMEEFKTVRRSSEQLFGSFDEDQLNATGIANDNPNYVMGIGYIIVGHSLHHMNIIKERYL